MAPQRNDNAYCEVEMVSGVGHGSKNRKLFVLVDEREN